jgi:hypothetical protein
MEARSMAIEADKRSASSSVPKATDNVNAADNNIDPSIKKDSKLN